MSEEDSQVCSDAPSLFFYTEAPSGGWRIVAVATVRQTCRGCAFRGVQLVSDHVSSSGQGQPGLLSSAQGHAVLPHLRPVSVWQNLRTRLTASWFGYFHQKTVVALEKQGKAPREGSEVNLPVLVPSDRLRGRRPRSQPGRRRARRLSQTGCCPALTRAGSRPPERPGRSLPLGQTHGGLHPACTGQAEEPLKQAKAPSSSGQTA